MTVSQNRSSKLVMRVRFPSPALRDVCAGARPGIAPAGRRHSHLLSLLAAGRSGRSAGKAHHGVVVGLVGLVEVDVGERRRPVDERLGVHDRHDHRVLHDLLVDLAPDRVPLGSVGDTRGLGEQVVDHRVVEHPDVRVTRRDDGVPGDQLV